MDQLPFQPKTVEFEIDDIKYTIKEILVTQRNILLFKIMQLGGEATKNVGGLDDNIGYGKMLHNILYKYDPIQGAAFVKEIILLGLQYPDFEKLGHKIGADKAYEQHFTEYYGHQIPVIQKIWEQNFGEHINDLKKKLTTSRIGTLTRLVFRVLFPEISETDDPEPPPMEE